MKGTAGFGLAEGFHHVVAPLAQVGCRIHAQQEIVLHDHDPIARHRVIGCRLTSAGHPRSMAGGALRGRVLFCNITVQPPTFPSCEREQIDRPSRCRAMTRATRAQTPEPATLLLVHGDILVRTALAAYLRECGYDVVEAGTTEEAVQALRLDMKFDLAFLDVEGDEGAGFGWPRPSASTVPRFASCWRPACRVRRPRRANSASRDRRSASPTTTGRWKGTSADCSRGDLRLPAAP